jgi:hypothetical protein
MRPVKRTVHARCSTRACARGWKRWASQCTLAGRRAHFDGGRTPRARGPRTPARSSIAPAKSPRWSDQLQPRTRFWSSEEVAPLVSAPWPDYWTAVRDWASSTSIGTPISTCRAARSTALWTGSVITSASKSVCGPSPRKRLVAPAKGGRGLALPPSGSAMPCLAPAHHIEPVAPGGHSRARCPSSRSSRGALTSESAASQAQPPRGAKWIASCDGSTNRPWQGARSACGRDGTLALPGTQTPPPSRPYGG